MALKDIQIPKADVQVGAGGSFAVRGLSTSDIEHCLREHGPLLHKMWDDFVTGKRKPEEALTDAGFYGILSTILKEAPTLVASVMYLAGDFDAEDAAVWAKLPAAVQVDALMKVTMQTLNVEGDMGKLIETVLGALGGVNGLLAGVNQALATS